MKKNNYNFTFSDYKKKLLDGRVIQIISNKKVLNYEDLLKSCDIGLSTVMLNKNIIREENLFPNLVTKEDYIAWLKITKNNTKAYNVGKILQFSGIRPNILSSNFYQKYIMLMDFEFIILMKN